MRIGIDVDNVLAVTFENIIREIQGNGFGVDCSFEAWEKHDFWDSFDVTRKDTIKIFDELIGKGFFRNVSVMPACRYIINRYNFENFYITARREDLIGQTMDWLANSDIQFESAKVISVGRGSWIEKEIKDRFKRKAFVARKLKLDCFIEDEGEVALEIAELGIPVILFNYPWNQHVHHPNIMRVGHWKDKCSYWREAENILRSINNKKR